MHEISPEDIMEASSEQKHRFLKVEHHEGIVKLVMNRPKVNYLTNDFLNEFLDVLNTLAFQQTNRILVIESALEYFTAGLSPESLKDDSLFISLDLFHRLIRQLFQINMLVISKVKGPAYGAGAGLAFASDFVLASPKARFGHPETRYGHFTPFALALYSRLMPRARAMYLGFSGDAIDAKTAWSWGLVTAVFPDEQYEERCERFIEKFAGYSGVAMEFARKTSFRALFPDLDELIHDIEDLYLVQLGSSLDAREGIQAWLEKRAPQWQHA